MYNSAEPREVPFIADPQEQAVVYKYTQVLPESAIQQHQKPT